MNFAELEATYKAKVQVAELEKARRRLATQEVIDQSLREELQGLQQELEPLLEFIRRVAEWVGPNDNPTFQVDLENRYYVLSINVNYLNINYPRPPATRMALVSKQFATGHAAPDRPKTIEVIRENADTLKMLRQVDFADLMELLMDYAVREDLDFGTLLDADYIRLNCS